MKKALPIVFIMLLLVTICYTQIGHLSNAFAEDFEISIKLSPETVVLSNKAEGFCGIHADIGYWAVETSTLKLTSEHGEIIHIDVAKADSYGDLIVMVNLEKVKAIVSPPSTTLTLSGYTNGGVLFYGSDIVEVRGRTKE